MRSIDQLSNKELIVDGYNGQIYVSPSPAVKKEFQALMLEETQLNAELDELQDLPAETQDGHTVALLVNTGLAQEVIYRH